MRYLANKLRVGVANLLTLQVLVVFSCGLVTYWVFKRDIIINITNKITDGLFKIIDKVDKQ